MYFLYFLRSPKSISPLILIGLMLLRGVSALRETFQFLSWYFVSFRKCDFCTSNWSEKSLSLEFRPIEILCKKAVVRGYSVKKVFLKISQYSQENTYTWNLKETLAQVFPVNFSKYLRTPFLQNTSGGCFCL